MEERTKIENAAEISRYRNRSFCLFCSLSIYLIPKLKKLQKQIGLLDFDQAPIDSIGD